MSAKWPDCRRRRGISGWAAGHRRGEYMDIRIGVIGLGYVGLPLALAFAKKFGGTVGFDINSRKVNALKTGVDINGEGLDAELKDTTLQISDRPDSLRGCNFFVVGVPTPIDQNKNPDLDALRGACETLGRVIVPGSTIVFESTVYPGVTEEVCGPIIEEISGLRRGTDFKLGYSPERMNPGDREHTVDRIVKVVSGEDAETLELVAQVYGSVVRAGIHKAPSIKVAEAAKVIENTQRDLNIALMNELSMIFDRLGISTRDVLDAAATKWNFITFVPGLVGGHCIGVDPYYLTAKAGQLGYHPQVILAGRRINDGMGSYIGQRTVKLMANAGIQVKGARVGILGLAFKENVSDIRNSRVPDIYHELLEFGVSPLVHDPYADLEAAREEYGIELSSWDELTGLDALILAVAHRHYAVMPESELLGRVDSGGVIVDVKGMLKSSARFNELTYWSL